MGIKQKTLITVLLLIAFCVLVVVTFGGTLNQAAMNNGWSLYYVHRSIDSTVFRQPAPSQHLRAGFWLARDALAHNDPFQAQVLIFPHTNDGNVEALSILGNAYAMQGQFIAAVNTWLQAEDYDSLSSAAEKAKRAGNLDDALLALQAAFSVNSEAGAGPLATFLLDYMNDPEQVSYLLEDIIHRYPNSVQQAEWCYLMGRVYAKKKQYADADIWFARAITLNPQSQLFTVKRANSVRESGELNHALDLYIQATKKFPNYAPIYYEMSWAYHLIGSTKEAVQSIEKAIQFMNPPNAWYQVRAGQLYLDDHQLDNALKAFQSAQSIDPAIGTTFLISFYQNTLKDPDQAIAVLQQTIANYPTATQHIKWMLQLAGIYRDNQLWDDAETIYKEILAEDPANLDAHIGLGWVFYSRSDGLTPAQVEFQKAIEGSPENGQGYLAMGQVLVKEKRYAEADPWFSKAIELTPDNSWWWIERGNALRSAGELTQAIQIYSEAISRFPNFATGYYELAWVYRLNNDRDKSIQAIESALSMISTPSEWYFVRAGQIYEWAESKYRAVAAYQEALKINPSNSYALEGLNRLSQ